MLKKSLIMCLFVFFGISNFAQNVDAESQLAKIFELSKAKNYSEAASFILYEGEDATRNLKSTFNYSERKEKIAVDRICKKIFALLDISDKYEIKSKSDVEKNGINWKVINVAFISGAQEIEGNFYMTQLGNKFVLGDID